MLDLGDVNNESCAEISDLAASLLEELTSSGFLFVKCSAIFQSDIDAVVAAADRFFSLPYDEKRKAITKDSARRGYCPANTENFASLIGEVKPNDVVEKFRIGPIDGHVTHSASNTIDKEHKKAFVHFTPNDWTHTPADFQQQMCSSYNRFSKLSAFVLKLIEKAMGLPLGYFASKMTNPTSIMSLNYYEPLGEGGDIDGSEGTVRDSGAVGLDAFDGEQICAPLPNRNRNPPPHTDTSTTTVRLAAHADVSMLTLVVQSRPSTGDGDSSSTSARSVKINELQILDTAGEWQSVHWVEGAVIINIGDCLRDWSGGVLKSTLHRVVERSSTPCTSSSVLANRYSAAYFVSPDYNAVMDTWPALHPQSSSADTGDGDAPSTATTAVQPSGGLTYTQWRKAHIKKSMQKLKSGVVSRK